MEAVNEALSLSERGPAVRFGVYVKPRASKTALAGVREGQLVVAVAAAPVEGEANGELVRALGELLGVPRRQVRIVAGQGGRSKVVEVEGLSAGEVRARLAPAAGAPGRGP
ncbi:MAG TPA: DUF167 domain-containing protein [Polyangiaceae bacterium]|nr:DUF167 domain-containing protein [Polyangiaceae bacterium]